MNAEGPKLRSRLAPCGRHILDHYCIGSARDTEELEVLGYALHRTYAPEKRLGYMPLPSIHYGCPK